MSFDLRPHQHECLANLLWDLDDGHNELLVVHPTGAGKSIVINELASEYITAFSLGSVLIISPYTQIIKQLHHTCKFHGKVKAELLSEVNMSTARVFLTTVQATNFEGVKDKLKRSIHSDVKLIICDEGHVGDEWFDSIRECYPNAKVVYFTATPYRANQYAFPGIKISHAVSMQNLIDEGLLVPPKLIETTVSAKYFPELTASAIKVYLENEYPKRSVWFFSTKEQAAEARNACIQSGIKAEYIVSDHGSEYRDEIIAKFSRHEISVLINVNVLSQGFDCPALESVFMPMGTKSVVLYIQRIGRALRPYPGKDEARIYVWDDAPSFKKGVYRRIQKLALRDKGDQDLSENKNDLLTELDWLESNERQDNVKIEWTKKTIEICETLKDKKLENVSQLLRYKKFPKKFLDNISEFSKFVAEPKDLNTESVSSEQSKVLSAKGFDESDIAKINFGEASALIAAVKSYESRHGYWAVDFGQYVGRHIKEIPHAYFGFLKKKIPNHPLLKLKAEWERNKKNVTSA